MQMGGVGGVGGAGPIQPLGPGHTPSEAMQQLKNWLEYFRGEKEAAEARGDTVAAAKYSDILGKGAGEGLPPPTGTGLAGIIERATYAKENQTWDKIADDFQSDPALATFLSHNKLDFEHLP